MIRGHVTERETKDNIFTSDLKEKHISNISEHNDKSKRQRNVASNHPGPKLDLDKSTGVYR